MQVKSNLKLNTSKKKLNNIYFEGTKCEVEGKEKKWVINS
jgi:NADH:ubiquinone oxidoreductase subunit